MYPLFDIRCTAHHDYVRLHAYAAQSRNDGWAANIRQCFAEDKDIVVMRHRAGYASKPQARCIDTVPGRSKAACDFLSESRFIMDIQDF